MISGIQASNPYVVVVNGYNSTPYVNVDHNNPMTGMIRLNGSNMEVFTGSSWMMIAMNNADINLSQTAISALEWAQKKMIEETKIKELAAKNITVADALARYEEAQEQLKMVLTLTDEQ